MKSFDKIYFDAGGKIDKQDEDFLKAKGWQIYHSRNTAYANKRTYFKNNIKRFKLHRLIMERILDRKLIKKEFIDHINHNGLDNRRRNIRLCTNEENLRHRFGPQKNNVSGYLGVCFDKRFNKWRATITINKVHKHLGYYTHINDAIKTRIEGEKKYFKEFARRAVDFQELET